MEISTLENWLWDAACSIRGEVDSPKYRDYILPLLFYKRLSDVYEDEINKLANELGEKELANKIAEKDPKLIRFYIPKEYTWNEIRKDPSNLGQRLTDAVREIAKENEKLKGVIDIVDYNATASGQRILDDDTLARLIEILNRYRLGMNDVEPDILGRAYEYLIRKFAEGSGQSAGEFYTPSSVARLMANILDPKPGERIYDPACGSGGLLIKCQYLSQNKHAQSDDSSDMEDNEISEPLRLYGQELLPTTYAMARMNCFIHDINAKIVLGDTMRNPKILKEDGELEKFDKVTANPMWNQEFPQQVYETDSYNRFEYGYPPEDSADWGWIQHMLSSLETGGKIAVVLDTSSVSRGSGRDKSREKAIRKRIVEKGFVESVILLPENLFYNTGAPGLIIVLNKKNVDRNHIKLINASGEFEKGSPKNFLNDENIKSIIAALESNNDLEALSRHVDIKTIRDLDYDLSPARHVPINPEVPIVPLHEAQKLTIDSFTTLRDINRERVNKYERVIKVISENEDGFFEDWETKLFKNILVDNIGGFWGDDSPEGLDDYIRCQVIRGTDFPDVSVGRLSEVPYRYIYRPRYDRRKLKPGDLIIEVSGGGKYQNTGRILYISKTLLESAQLPLLYTNFTRRLRVDKDIVIPKYAYYAWKHLYELGKTARYEKQPTNIRNFKYKDFLAHESIMYPKSKTRQREIVNTLDLIVEEGNEINNFQLSLKSLRYAAMSKLLYGEKKTNT